MFDSAVGRVRRVMPKDYHPLLSDSVVYGIAIMASRSFAFLTTPLITRAFGPSEYGALDLILSIILFIQIVMSLSIESALNRYYYEMSEGTERSTFISTILGFVLLMGSAVTIVVALVTPLVGPMLFQNHAYNFAFALAVAASFLQLLGIMFQWVFRLARRRRAFLQSVGVFLIPNFLLILLLVVWGNGGLNAYFIALAVAALCQCGVSFWLLRRELVWSFSNALLRRSLRFALPYVPTLLIGAVFTMLGRFLLLNTSTLEQVGFFAIASKLAVLLLLVFTPFQMAWQPFAMSVMKRANMKQIYANVMRYSALILFLSAGVIISLAPELVHLIAGDSFAGAVPMTPLIVLGTVAVLMGTIFSIAIVVGERTMFMLYPNLVSLLVYVLAGAGLLQLFGAIGIAMAFLLANLVGCALAYWFAQRIQRIAYPYHLVIIAMGSAILVTLALEFFALSFVARLAVLVINSAFIIFLFGGKNFLRFWKEMQRGAAA